MSGSKKSSRDLIVLVAVIAATFLEMLDSTIVNVSLPYIGGTLSVTSTEATWGVSAYICANAVTLPTVATLERRIGGRLLLTIALQSFALMSALCAFAPNISVFVMCRALQGCAGAIMQPIAYAAALSYFGDSRRTLGIVLLGTVTTLAPAVGPVIGGWVTDVLGWQAAFLINVPCACLAAMAIIAFYHPQHRESGTSSGHSVVQIVPLMIAVLAVQFVIDKGSFFDWTSSALIDGLAMVGCLLLGIFLLIQWTSKAPLLNVRSILKTDFLVGLGLIFVQNAVLFGGVILVPLLLENERGYSSLETGVWVIPRGVGALSGMMISNPIVKRWSAQNVLAVSCLVVAASSIWLTLLPLDTSYMDLFWPQYIAGLGSAVGFIITSQIAFSGIEEAHIVDASSLFTFVGNLGSTLGIACATYGTEVLTQRALSDMKVHSSTYGAILTNRLNTFLSGGRFQPESTKRALAHLATVVNAQASVIGINHMFGLMALAMLLIAPLGFIPYWMRKINVRL